MDQKIALLEAVLFMANEPISLDRIGEIMGIGSKGYISELIKELKKDFASHRRGIELVERNGKYELRVKKEYLDRVYALSPHRDLSKGSLRTLALIAFNSPVEQSKIVKIRGNKAYNQIAELKRKGLVESEKKGRVSILNITDEFLNYFGFKNIEEFKEAFLKEDQKLQ